ncbi:hypothetical protein WN48_07863 [Eufriesea mexicana]|nr:hypothetical protein WN48_07863 [Eufriesea mexicana]
MFIERAYSQNCSACLGPPRSQAFPENRRQRIKRGRTSLGCRVYLEDSVTSTR